MPFGLQIALLPWMLLLLFLCLFVAVANFWRITEIWRRSRPSIGGFVAHIGMALLLGGLILSRGFERTEKLIVREDRVERALDYAIQFKGLTDPTLKDRDGKALFQVIGREGSFIARPGLYYTMQGEEEKPTVWPHVERLATHDVYFALEPPQTSVWEQAEAFKVGETRTIPHPTPTSPSTSAWSVRAKRA